MVNKIRKIEKSYILFFICLYPVITSFIDNYVAQIQLKRELLSPPTDLNVQMAQSIVANFNYVDLVTDFTQDPQMYISFLMILLGLFLGDVVFRHRRDNAYYIMRNRLSYSSYMLLIYKTVLKRLFVIEGILVVLIFTFALLLGGINTSIIFFIESLVPFVFIYLYSSLIILLTINLNSVISNMYVLKLMPFILMYAPILASAFLYKIIPNEAIYTKFSYLTYVPSFSYATTNSQINFINWLNGSLTPDEVSYLTQYIKPFVIPYLLLIFVVILTFNIGKERDWYA